MPIKHNLHISCAQQTRNLGACVCLLLAVPCPDGDLYKCYGDPCSTVRCAKGYHCAPNYCGGCHAQCLKDTFIPGKFP